MFLASDIVVGGKNFQEERVSLSDQFRSPI